MDKNTNKNTFGKLLNIVIILWVLHGSCNLYMQSKSFDYNDQLFKIKLSMCEEYRYGNFGEVELLLNKGDSIHKIYKAYKRFGSAHSQNDDYHNEHYTVMGLLAMQHGDIIKAYEYLIESSKIKSTPVLSSFGPELSLAKKLLRYGEKEKVIEYLTLIRPIWKFYQNQIDLWIIQIRQGKSLDHSFDGHYKQRFF